MVTVEFPMHADLLLSVIVPALNEGAMVVPTLAALQPLRASGHEVLLVDGGSADDTTQRARPLVDRVLTAPRGRARQMNAGAAAARGDVFWFVHADTVAPRGADGLILDAMQDADAWGHFDVRLSGRHPLLRVVERTMNWRSRWTGIATGDGGIFVRRAAFAQIGGFPDIPLMEDVAISRALKRLARPRSLRATLLTSSRRWEEHGVARTVVLMWRLRLAYFLGADPARLAAWYREG